MTVAMQTPPSSATISLPLMTEVEFLAEHGGESGVDLIDGVVVRNYDMPGFIHGVSGNRLATRLTVFAEDHNLGRVATNDTFVKVRDYPVRIRGADILFLSYEKWPASMAPPAGVTPATPELVGEVKSPSDTWTQVFTKVLDYLDAGVRVVIVLDPDTQTATAYRPDTIQEIFRSDSDLTIPDLFPGFAVSVASLFR